MPPLAEHIIHYTIFSLRQDESLFLAYLSDDEMQRANQFKFEKDRQAFIAARGQLRQYLANYLQVEPNSLEFSYGEHGKPALINHDLKFNLSHAGDYALIAVSRNFTLGVDIECMDRTVEMEGIAEKVFTANEIQCLDDAKDKAERFFTLWTRKEALIKANGKGLFTQLTQLDVVGDDVIDEQGQSWKIMNLPDVENYKLALAHKSDSEITPSIERLIFNF